MANILNNITSFTKGFFEKEAPSVLGIDISSSAIKVVQLKRERGRAVLETYGALALGPYNDRSVGQSVRLSTEALAQALTDVLTESKTTTRSAAAAIPLSSSLVTRIEVPALKEEKLKSIIPLEARKYIPVSISEVMLDWHVIPKGDVPEDDRAEGDSSSKGDKGGRKTEVLLVAIHNDTIRNVQTMLKEAGFAAGFFEIEVFSTTRSVLGPGVAPALVVDFGASTTKLYVIEAGVIKTSHIVNRGGQDITLMISKSLGLSFGQAEELKRLYGVQTIDREEDVGKSIQSSIEYLLTEIERTVVSFERRYNRPITSITFTGGGSNLSGLRERAAERLSADIRTGNPFEKTQTPAFLEDALREAGPEFAVAVGIALRELEERS